MNELVSPFRAIVEPHGGAGSQDSAAANDPFGQIDLLKLIASFRRRQGLFLAVVCIVFVGVALITLHATPRYTATANVMIDARTEKVTDVQDVLSSLTPGNDGVIETEVQVILSRQLAGRVVTALKLDSDPEFNPRLRPPSPVGAAMASIKNLVSASSVAPARPSQMEVQKRSEAIVNQVLGRLSVSRQGLTYIIKIGFTSTDPAKAAQIANTFATLYLTEQMETKFDATQQANQWLNERIGQLKTQAEDADAAVEQYKIANNLLSADGTTLTEQEISGYNQQTTSARAQLAEDQARLNTANEQIANGSTGEDVGEALTSEVIQKLREQRSDVTGRIADLQGRYGPRHPEMLKAQRQLEDIDAQIKAEIARIISNLQAKVQVSQQRLNSIQGSLSGARGSLVVNNRAEVKLRELQRNSDATRTLYENFLNRFKETTADTGGEQSDARVVSRAAIPLSPSAPNIPLNLGLGLTVGLLAALAAIVLAEFLDSGLATADDVEQRLSVPSLGSIPLLSTVTKQKGALPDEYAVQNPLSSFAEAFRNLRASILQSRLGVPVKIIAITSSLPGEGKTTTSIGLGRALAAGGSRVVIVDCDLRRRSVNRMLGVAPTAGLLEVLNGDVSLDQVLQPDELTDALFLPLSAGKFTPKDVFDSPAMDQLLAKLKERFDFVLLDTAPVLPIADTRVLAPKADVVVFLTRWRKTPEKAVGAALKMLRASGSYIGGIALTQVDMKQIARYGYGDAGYYYGSYKNYYSS